MRYSELSLSGCKPKSLAQAKVDRWSNAARIKELEEQLQDRDGIVRLNLELRDRLERIEESWETARYEYEVKLEEQGRSRYADEKYIKELEADLEDAQQSIRSASFEREKCVREVSRLENENKAFREELDRVQSAILESIDRQMHLKIVEDLRNEISCIRQSLSEAIPQSIHDRLVSQLNDARSLSVSQSSETDALRAQISQLNAEFTDRKTKESLLKSEKGQLENENRSLRDSMQKLKDDIRLSHTLIEDGRKYRLTAEALKESVKRSTELAIDLDRRRDRENELLDDLSNIRNLREIEAEVFGKAKLQLASLKHDLSDFRNQVLDQSVGFHDSIARKMNEILTKRGADNYALTAGIWNILNKLGFVSSEWPRPCSVEDLLMILRTTLTAVASEVSRTATESALVERELSRRDHELREMRALIGNLERARGEEKRVVSGLRDSIESAERRISHRSPLRSRTDN